MEGARCSTGQASVSPVQVGTPSPKNRTYVVALKAATNPILGQGSARDSHDRHEAGFHCGNTSVRVNRLSSVVCGNELLTLYRGTCFSIFWQFHAAEFPVVVGVCMHYTHARTLNLMGLVSPRCSCPPASLSAPCLSGSVILLSNTT